MFSYAQDLLSDAESYLIEARQGNRWSAQEALDTVNLYQSLRESGDQEEPWFAADAYAGDMETEALYLLRKLAPKPRAQKKAVRSPLDIW